VRDKRRTRLAAIAAMLVAAALPMAACGDDDEGDSAAAAGGAATADPAPASGGTGVDSWCGDKEVVLGIQDGGGLNGWSKESLKQVQLEADKCPAIKEQKVVNAGFDVQKAISGFNGLVAQGANAIVIIPDAGGPAEVPAIRNATRREVKVVPWASEPGAGEAGTDYVTYVDWDTKAAGRTWAEWLVEQIGGKGNVVFLGGPAGNFVDRDTFAGASEVLSQSPDVKLVTDKPAVANWDPAQTQKVTAGLLAKTPQIDGIIVADGQSGAGAIRAFKAAGKKIPPIATLEANEIACLWQDAKDAGKSFPLMTLSARNWLGRYAVRKAVAAVNGLEEPSKSIVELPIYEDSEGGKAPECRPDAAPDSFFSNEASDEELDKIMQGG
jgi:ribose transport system substrate-binding protein